MELSCEIFSKLKESTHFSANDTYSLSLVANTSMLVTLFNDSRTDSDKRSEILPSSDTLI